MKDNKEYKPLVEHPAKMKFKKEYTSWDQFRGNFLWLAVTLTLISIWMAIDLDDIRWAAIVPLAIAWVLLPIMNYASYKEWIR